MDFISLVYIFSGIIILNFSCYFKYSIPTCGLPSEQILPYRTHFRALSPTLACISTRSDKSEDNFWDDRRTDMKVAWSSFGLKSAVTRDRFYRRNFLNILNLQIILLSFFDSLRKGFRVSSRYVSKLKIYLFSSALTLIYLFAFLLKLFLSYTILSFLYRYRNSSYKYERFVNLINLGILLKCKQIISINIFNSFSLVLS